MVYSCLMRILLFLALISVLTPCGARDVYRSVSDDGVVIYSDTYIPGSERVTVSDHGSSVKKQTSSKENPQSSDSTAEDDEYQSFAIAQPENDETIRSNEGTVSVGLSLSPTLLMGHKIHVFVDGAKLDAEITTTQFSLNDLNRGTHSLQAKIVDAEGTVLKSTDSINFHLRKASIKNR